MPINIYASTGNIITLNRVRNIEKPICGIK